jgi:hypothetical protein
MASYLEEVARWRMQRHQQQAQDRVNQLVGEYREVVRERDSALSRGDVEEAELRDNDAIQLEREWQQMVPPQQPQWNPKDIEFLRRKQAFRERHGQAADAAIRQAHDYVTRPRLADPNISNVNYHGMGIRPHTPAYYKRMNDLLELYSKEGGLTFDPNESGLTPTEAAKISGVSAQTYNNASRQLAAQGRFKR